MPEEKYAAVILGAGKGTRMNEGQASSIPKVMFEANGQPLIRHAVDLIKSVGIDQIVVVVGYKKEMIMDFLGDEVEYAEQAEQLGTGHAVQMAESLLKGKAESIIVFYGDHTLWKIETVKRLIVSFEDQRPTIAMLSVTFEDPNFWAFGRIIRSENGDVCGSIEQKDCTDEQRQIKECNPCFYIFDAKWLWENIFSLQNENAQKEYYLTDLVALAVEQNKKIIAVKVSEETEALGINTPEQLKEAEAVLKTRN